MIPTDDRRLVLDALRNVHRHLVWPHRVRALSSLFPPLLPTGASVLDIGCGDGAISARIRTGRADLSISGVEIRPRPHCAIDVRAFDGTHLPFPDGSFDFCLLIDVIHHVADAERLLCEARRVTRKGVLIKDHISRSRLDALTLAAMDWMGNRTYGLHLPHWYRDEKGWAQLFAACGLAVAFRRWPVALYPLPFGLLFNRRLHFVALLEQTKGVR